MTISYEEFCEIYRTLKIHFTNDKYDITKYEGRINKAVWKIPKSLLNNEGMATKLEVLKHKYRKRERIIQYMVANFVKGDNYGGVFNDIDGDDIYLEWKQRTESLTYNFKKDINTIKDSLKDDTISTLFESSGNHPKIMKLYMGKYVMLETVVILDSIYEFTEELDKILNDDFMWNKFKRLVCKYKPFLNIDKEKYESIIENTFT